MTQERLFNTFIVTAAEDGKKLQQVLKNRYHFSRRWLRRLKQGQYVLVNDEASYLSARIHSGDEIRIFLPDEITLKIEPEAIPLRISYEDEDIVVVDKPAGIVVHPTKGYPNGTLANGLAYHFLQQGRELPIRPVSRLDKDTSGLLMMAKHAYTHDFLSKEMKKKRYQRQYVAIVHGQIADDVGTINRPIAHDPVRPIHRWVNENGAQAITHYEVLERKEGATLVSLQLETGRTHQIRVHLSDYGHPIIGDRMYAEGWKDYGIKRQALHATRLSFIHPRDGKEYMFFSPLSQDMKELWAKL
ncbi:RluA family pseudouridine synthase [Mechercharimyces sp. CAU 1602]|uniref:RluA family pseudouridine synthase n=1 Tax=Mechercharimyces sp. CAU 1602 TaxID=2973933 RepID=UPI0021639E54|nr:RluA family pseudouridine synthase [Mechercharimyces sp. CAU 1602]MCS1351991.1 RluA family pseudouridine synthase [Mechercharimyces sp. CAU 1602]